MSHILYLPVVLIDRAAVARPYKFILSQQGPSADASVRHLAL